MMKIKKHIQLVVLCTLVLWWLSGSRALGVEVTIESVVAGKLKEEVVKKHGNLEEITSLTIGNETASTKAEIDARDFVTMRDEMKNLQTLDLTHATIVELKGSTEGTANDGATQVNYPANTIPSQAFYKTGATIALQFIKLPASLVSIDSLAFKKCSNLKSVIPNPVSSGNYKLEHINKEAFKDCSALEIISLEQLAWLKTIGESAFEACSKLPTMNFTGGVSLQIIENGAFKDCTSLKKIDFSGCAALKEIKSYSFAGCGQLATLNLTGCKALEEIGSGAFQNTIITDLDLISSESKERVKIFSGAFSSCKSLKNLYIGVGGMQFDDYAKGKGKEVGVFRGTAIEHIRSYSANLPDFDSTEWASTPYKEATLTLPVGKVQEFKEKKGWRDFKIVRGLLEMADTIRVEYSGAQVDAKSSLTSYLQNREELKCEYLDSVGNSGQPIDAGEYKIKVVEQDAVVGYKDSIKSVLIIAPAKQTISGVEPRYKLKIGDAITFAPRSDDKWQGIAGVGNFTYSNTNSNVAELDATGNLKVKSFGRDTVTITSSGTSNVAETSIQVAIQVVSDVVALASLQAATERRPLQFDQEFHPDSLYYTIKVAGDDSKIAIVGKTQDELATVVDYKEPVDLKGGYNYFQVKSIAEDTAISRTYHIQVYKEIVLTGIEDQQQSVLKVYPNPTRGPVTVEWPSNSDSEGPLEVYSLQGTLLQRYAAGEQANLGSLGNGVYVLRKGRSAALVRKQ